MRSGLHRIWWLVVTHPAGRDFTPARRRWEQAWNLSRSHFLRCPLPALWNSTPDSQRQAYRGAVIPQFRVMLPQQSQAGGSAAGSSGTTAASGGSSGGGSGGGSGPTQPTAQSVSTTSGSLNPNQSFVSSVQVAKSFALLGVTASGPVRHPALWDEGGSDRRRIPRSRCPATSRDFAGPYLRCGARYSGLHLDLSGSCGS